MNDEKPMNLAVIDCCATCEWWRGWLDNAWCAWWYIKVAPHTKCDSFKRKPGLPMWVLVAPIED